MVNYSVEFAHIYLNQSVAREHRRSAALFGELRTGFAANGESYRSVVLIDDYNATEQVLEPGRLIAALARMGTRPHYVAYESQLVGVARQLLKATNGREGKSSQRFLAEHQRAPCSLLIAAWYLVRLGMFPPPTGLFDWELSRQRHFEPAHCVVNVLPEYYRGVEKRACSLLRQSPYHAACGRVRNKYFAS